MTEVHVPAMGESVQTATVARWHRRVGETVAADEPLVTLDSDKASMDVPAPASGRVAELRVAEGATVRVGEVLAMLEPVAELAARPVEAAGGGPKAGPAVRQAAREAGVDLREVAPSGPRGRATREDVAAAARAQPAEAPVAAPVPTPARAGGEEVEEVVPMSTIRRRIAERLLEAKQTTAMLTTFNEIDMSAVMALRERWQERFAKRYGIKLGFMSFFVKAAIDALKAFPAANAEIRGESIVYKHYYHIGVAVSGPRGLVVPVLRHADRLSFAETEQAIAAFGERARNNQLGVDDLRGGSFTISNGGIFGSLMSTPILNPPQVAILGMHAIQKRPVVVGEDIVARPMMYVAVSYDHRLLDGREAVGFLVRIKECVENPERILLEV